MDTTNDRFLLLFLRSRAMTWCSETFDQRCKIFSLRSSKMVQRSGPVACRFLILSVRSNAMYLRSTLSARRFKVYSLRSRAMFHRWRPVTCCFLILSVCSKALYLRILRNFFCFWKNLRLLHSNQIMLCSKDEGIAWNCRCCHANIFQCIFSK